MRVCLRLYPVLTSPTNVSRRRFPRGPILSLRYENNKTCFNCNYIAAVYNESSRFLTRCKPCKPRMIGETNVTIASGIEIKVADEVWIAAALLHREHPDQTDFAIERIMQRATEEAGKQPLRPGVYVHVVQHCVANRPPNPGRYRMLYETAPGRRRLFRSGDNYDSAREGAKIVPTKDDIPSEYAALLDWYRDWAQDSEKEQNQERPPSGLRGSARNSGPMSTPMIMCAGFEGWVGAASSGIPTSLSICGRTTARSRRPWQTCAKDAAPRRSTSDVDSYSC